MPIRKTPDSEFYEVRWKDFTYKCVKCDNEYYVKYKNNDNVCMWCAFNEELKSLN
jgi:peptide methionine sulfoxide reductase MsrB